MNQMRHGVFPAEAERNKLLQLRDKTDRQVFQFIQARLDAGLKLAMEAAYEHAAEILDEIEKLWPVLTETQRRELDTKLSELRLALRPRYAAVGARG